MLGKLAVEHLEEVATHEFLRRGIAPRELAVLDSLDPRCDHRWPGRRHRCRPTSRVGRRLRARRRREERGVLEQRLGRHDSLGTGLLHAPVDISEGENVAIGDDRNLDRSLDCRDRAPVRQTVALALPRAAMHPEDLLQRK